MGIGTLRRYHDRHNTETHDVTPAPAAPETPAPTQMEPAAPTPVERADEDND